MNMQPRPIKNDIPIVNHKPENEKPSRWSFMKVLREHSDLKEYYPEINPYAEAYKFRDDVYCIFLPSVAGGLGDMWAYLIIGSEKALLIDTGLGLGDLRGLCEKLADGREIICANTHNHVDHIGGNSQFDKVYINEFDAPLLEDQNNPDYMRNWLLDENGNPKGSEYDTSRLVEYHHYEIVAVPDGYTFDLGDGHIVELIHLSGHTAGQSAFYDHSNHCLFIGDTTSAFGGVNNERFPQLCTVNSFRDRLAKLIEKYGNEISGVFPGHGALDLHPMILQYELDTCNQIIAHPDWSSKTVMFGGMPLMAQFIYQFGSDFKYSADAVIPE